MMLAASSLASSPTACRADPVSHQENVPLLLPLFGVGRHEDGEGVLVLTAAHAYVRHAGLLDLILSRHRSLPRA